jgi:arylsulfatase A-like enzyme
MSPQSAPRSAVVIVVDRLGAGFLGPFGNAWVDTPELNRLASQSLVCETALADSGGLPTIYRSYWTGRHALEPAGQETSLSDLARAAGLRARLFTDEPAVAEHPLAAGFAERTLAPLLPAQRGEELEGTAIGRLFGQAIEKITADEQPGLFWLHSRGMAGPWDAPLALRNQFADEEDPLPPDIVDPPELRLAEGYDPDELLGLVHAYAGQVALVDAAIGVLLDALDASPLAAETLVVFTSPRGYPLGEHGRVGPCDSALYGELLHVPALLRVPGAGHERTQRLVQPGDLFATLADWLGLPAERPATSVSLIADERDDPARGGQIACAIGPGQRAIRTPAWFLRESLIEGERRHELFAKPDDRWEANEVSSRCGDVVELLAAQLDACEQAARAGELAPAAPLAEILADVWR